MSAGLFDSAGGEKRDLLAGLNSAQREAVLHGAEDPPRSGGPPNAGPLIVLAGPGTGKTRVITHRIAHLIREGGADPASIVAVTFTIKAAGELRSRLRELVGASMADRVNASTFHALGHRLLRRFGDTLPPVAPPEGLDLSQAPLPNSRAARLAAARNAGVSGDFGPGILRVGLIDSAQRRRLMRWIVSKLELLPQSRALGIDDAVNAILSHVDCLSEQAILPDDCAAFVGPWEANIAKGLSSGGAALDETALEAERASLRVFRDVARGYAAYDAALRSAGLVTFSDLITLPIRILRRRDSRAAAIVRSEWRHFVVDEFQDVNAGQIALLKELAPPAAGPDICVVGDDDQSIYAFRGADERAFSRFEHVWGNKSAGAKAGGHAVRTIKLEDNYRSSPSIVALANSVIEKAETRFAPDKVIRAQREGAEGTLAGPVTGVLVNDDSQCSGAISAMLHTMRACSPALFEKSAEEDADAGEGLSIAVIARNNGESDTIAQALRLDGWRVLTPRFGSVTDDAGVQDVMAWIELLCNPRRSWSARRLLARGPGAERVPVDRLAEIERAYDAATAPEDGRHPELTRPAHAEFLRFVVDSTDAGDPVHEAGAALLKTFDELAAFAAAHNAHDTIRRIVAASGVAHAELLPAIERAKRVDALVQVIRFADQIQDRLDPPGDLRAFLAYYNDLDKAEQSMTGLGTDEERLDGDSREQEGFAEAVIEGAAAAAGRSRTGPVIHVINAHKAKGLEFDVVFVPRVSPPWGYPTTGKRDSERAGLPAGLLCHAHGEGTPDTSTDSALEEERRVFYVACTRARSRLVLLSKKTKSRSKSTHFFQELMEESELREHFEVVGIGDVLGKAAEAGAATAADLDDEGLGEGDSDSIERARRRARAEAAAALDGADRPGVTGPDLCAIAAKLRESAVKLALIASAGRADDAETRAAALEALASPGEERERLARFCESLSGALRGHGARGGGSGFVTRPLSPPLRLSFSHIDAYTRCPRCYYLRYVLGLPEKTRASEVVGSAVHRALELFVGEERSRESHAGSDAEARVYRLVALGRRAFYELWPVHEPIDAEQLSRVELVLRGYLEKYHRDTDHVLEIERDIVFPIALDGAAPLPDGKSHTIRAKIDRIDQVTLADGSVGVRIVDYKTGKGWKKLTDPDGADMQLGIYAMACAHYLGTPDSLPRGTAEFWILSTGERGVLDLSKLRLDKVRQRIEEVIDGMCAGRFEREEDCEGDCGLFEGE